MGENALVMSGVKGQNGSTGWRPQKGNSISDNHWFTTKVYIHICILCIYATTHSLVTYDQIICDHNVLFQYFSFKFIKYREYN